MISKVDRELARQRGVISRSQARALGLSERQIDHRVASGAWVKVLPCVYRDAASPTSWEQGVVAAWLWSGHACVVSHRAAAKIFGMMGIENSPFEISSPHWKRGAIIKCHRTHDFSDWPERKAKWDSSDRPYADAV